MAHAEISTPTPILSIAQLSQWKVDHERDDTRQFASIDRKLNWLIGGLFSVALAICGYLYNENATANRARIDRLEAAQPAAAMVASAPAQRP